MYRKFVQFIEKNKLFEKNEKLVVGVSGGADSVCLLSLLCKLKEEMNFQITVVHVNHQIREEADKDADFVRALCEKNKVEFVLRKYQVNSLAKEWNMSSEEAGRKVRYETFSEVLGEDLGKIVVAHNQNDVAETVLFNLFRGSASAGLSGIKPMNGNIVRPLLCFSRDEIEAYLKEINLEYCIDQTNLTDDYTRNKIRNHILPYAEENIVKGSTSHIYATAAFLREQEEYLEEETERNFHKVANLSEEGTTLKIIGEEFLKLHGFMQKRVVYKAIEQLAKSRKDITSKHIDGVINLFHKEGMKCTDLPYNLQAKSSYKDVSIGIKEKDLEEKIEERPLEEAKEFTFRVFSAKMPDTIPEKQYTKWFDYDKIEGTLTVRSWREGDYLTVLNGKHQKSLHRYFIDEKIPKDERDKILLVTQGSHVLWIVGRRISDHYKLDENTKQIIEIHYDGGL